MMNGRVMAIGIVALVLAIGGTVLSIFYKQAVVGLLMIAAAWILSRFMGRLNAPLKKK
jgi:hypothetical protein